MLNSLSAIVIVPKNPYITWAQTCADNVQVNAQTFCSDPTVWLIPDLDSFSTEEERKAFIENAKLHIFPKLLSDWDPDESTWPTQNFTLELFDQWFDSKIHRVARHFDDGDFEEELFADDNALDNSDDDLFEDDEDEEFEPDDDLDENSIDEDLALDEDLEPNPQAHAALMAAVNNQLKANEPPQAKLTFKRLISQGIDPVEARRLVGTALLSEMLEIMKTGEEYDVARYVAKLELLPKTPWLNEQ